MGHYDECREGYCEKCGQVRGHCQHTKEYNRVSVRALGVPDVKGDNTMQTNFDHWKETLTPEFFAEGKFIMLSCGACPANGVTCNKYDTTCRGNFLNWARRKYENE